MAPPRDLAPDDASQVSMSGAMALVAGEGLGIRAYRVEDEFHRVPGPRRHGGPGVCGVVGPRLSVKGGCSVKGYGRERTTSI